jgi:large subunit ribosomal protein L44
LVEKDPSLGIGLSNTVSSYTESLSRLLKETGRFSIAPVFVVGIYFGQDKLGEGFGSSLSMAEFRVRILPPYSITGP